MTKPQPPFIPGGKLNFHFVKRWGEDWKRKVLLKDRRLLRFLKFIGAPPDTLAGLRSHYESFDLRKFVCTAPSPLQRETAALLREDVLFTTWPAGSRILGVDLREGVAQLLEGKPWAPPPLRPALPQHVQSKPAFSPGDHLAIPCNCNYLKTLPMVAKDLMAAEFGVVSTRTLLRYMRTDRVAGKPIPFKKESNSWTAYACASRTWYQGHAPQTKRTGDKRVTSPPPSPMKRRDK